MIRLLVIQSTPFCNIDCEYCYLPDRSNTNKISLDVIEAIGSKILSSNIVAKEITIVWHAGEPLVYPISLYEEVFTFFNHIAVEKSIKITHSFQTNAILLNDSWCSFIKKWEVEIGVSIDGPERMHNYKRLTRKKKGTFSKVMNGVKHLNRWSIPFHVISVLTDLSIKFPDELCEFYLSNGMFRVGFNIDEIEGYNKTSSFENIEKSVFSEFINRIITWTKSTPLEIREFKHIRYLIEGKRSITDASQRDPLAIVVVDYQGNVSSFSPELLGNKSQEYGDFVYGNIVSDTLDKIIDSPLLKKTHKDILLGVNRCKTECKYYLICGGGEPSNKFFENKSFDSTITTYCENMKIILGEAIVSDYERDYQIFEV